MNKPQEKKGKEGEGDPKPRKRREGGEPRETLRYATRPPRLATPRQQSFECNANTTWAHGPCMHQSDIPVDRNLSLMLTNNHKHYKRKHGHATALKMANTPPKNAKNT